MIDHNDLEIVLDDYATRRNSPTINDYLSAIAYPKTTRLEREAALIVMRRAWVAALSQHLKPSHARGYVLRQEFYVRETMNTVDGLPVAPLPWSPHWPQAH